MYTVTIIIMYIHASLFNIVGAFTPVLGVTPEIAISSQDWITGAMHPCAITILVRMGARVLVFFFTLKCGRFSKNPH